jgi:hypothetical protein
MVNRSVGTYALFNRIRNEDLTDGPSFWRQANWNLSDGEESVE